MTHCGGEDTSRFARGPGKGLGPGHGCQFLGRIRRIGGLHAGEDLAHDDRRAIAVKRRQTIHVGWPPDIVQSPGDGMVLHALGDQPPGALHLMVPVVGDPGLAQDLPAVTALVIGAASEGVLGVEAVLVLHIVERVGSGPQRDDRPARVRVVDDLLHLLVRQFAKSREEDQQISLSEGPPIRECCRA